MPRLLSLVAVSIVIVTGCTTAASSARTDIDARALVLQAANNIRSSDTFRMILEQSGADYQFEVYVNDRTNPTSASLRRIEAQYVLPDVLFANANLSIAGIPITIDVFARGQEQWWRFVGGPWFNSLFAPDFDPVSLVAEDSGFNQVMSTLSDLEFVGEETLIDGTPVYHVRGGATGDSVEALLVGLVQQIDDVEVDVYINRDTQSIAMVTITQPSSVTEDDPQPTTWTIEIFDIDAQPDFDDPEA